MANNTITLAVVKGDKKVFDANWYDLDMNDAVTVQERIANAMFALGREEAAAGKTS